MYPRMFGGLDLKPECLQPLLFTCEIGESYSNAMWSTVDVAASVP